MRRDAGRVVIELGGCTIATNHRCGSWQSTGRVGTAFQML